MNQFKLENLWVSVEGIPGVAFRFGDEVRVGSGERAGDVGRVVALMAVEPAPTYMVEFPDGRSEGAAESDLERAV